MIRRAAPEQLHRIGHLAHHLLSLINHLWLREDNNPIRVVTGYRDPDFTDILTTVSPAERTRFMTPQHLATGFDSIFKISFYHADYRQTIFDWVSGTVDFGDTKTLLSPPSDHSNLTTSQATLETTQNTVLGAPASANQPDARTRFTGTKMPSNVLFLLTRELMRNFWGHSAKDWIGPMVREHPTVIVRGHDPDEPPDPPQGASSSTSRKVRREYEVWCLEFVSTAVYDANEQEITFEQLTSRLLRMIQLPAHLERWETIQSDFHIGNKKIAMVSLYKETPRVNVS